LRERVGEQPVIVLGHSWGTMLGARLVARLPEDYAGYIGVGQQVDTLRGAALTLDWLREVGCALGLKGYGRPAPHGPPMPMSKARRQRLRRSWWCKCRTRPTRTTLECG
jgi:pimeloyl-ACP methyl ester carboxylesterase